MAENKLSGLGYAGISGVKRQCSPTFVGPLRFERDGLSVYRLWGVKPRDPVQEPCRTGVDCPSHGQVTSRSE